MKTMGERIKDLRLALKMSQQQVSDGMKRLGFPISQRGLSKLEGDQVAQPKSATIRGLAKFHQVDPDWLVTGKGPQSPISSLSPEESELILLFRALSPSGQSYILGRAREVYRDEHDKAQESEAEKSATPPRRPSSH